MTRQATGHRLARGLRLAVVLASIGGVLLFAWSIRTAGAQTVLRDVKRLGAGFTFVFLLGGVRHLVRTVAWTCCLEAPADLSPARAFLAYVAGDSLGNVTPFGFLISEPSKIVLVRHRVAPEVSISALTIENLFYSVTVAVMLVVGTAALLFSFAVPTAVRVASLVTLGGTMAFLMAATWILMTRRRVISRLCAYMIRRHIAHGYFEARLPHAREIEDRIFGFIGRCPRRVVPIVALEITFHAAAILEIWMVLTFITRTPPTFLTAFVLEYVNRTITSVFQFVPMWLGVDEAGTGLMTAALHLGPAAGVSLALIRKGRMMAWTAIGIGMLLQQGLSLRSTLREAELLRS